VEQGEAAIVEGDVGELSGVVAFDDAQWQDVGRITSGSLDAGSEGSGIGGQGRDEEDGALLAGGAIGQRQATREAGGEVEGQQGGADAGWTFQQGEVTEGDVVGPEPVEWASGKVSESGEDETRGGGHG